MLGGIGNIPGAMIGGLFLGVVESDGAGIVPRRHRYSGPLPDARLIAFTVLIMVLIFRPQGLFGGGSGQEAGLSPVAFDIVAASRAEQAKTTPWRHAITTGLAPRRANVFMAVVGILMFPEPPDHRRHPDPRLCHAWPHVVHRRPAGRPPRAVRPSLSDASGRHGRRNPGGGPAGARATAGSVDRSAERVRALNRPLLAMLTFHQGPLARRCLAPRLGRSAG